MKNEKCKSCQGRFVRDETIITFHDEVYCETCYQELKDKEFERLQRENIELNKMFADNQFSKIIDFAERYLNSQLTILLEKCLNSKNEQSKQLLKNKITEIETDLEMIQLKKRFL